MITWEWSKSFLDMADFGQHLLTSPDFPRSCSAHPPFALMEKAQKIANLKSSSLKRAQKPHIINFWLHNHKSLCICFTDAFPQFQTLMLMLVLLLVVLWSKLVKAGQSWCRCWLCLNTPYKRPLCYWCFISSPLNPIFWEKKRVLRSLWIHFKKLPLYIFHLSMFLVNHERD